MLKLIICGTDKVLGKLRFLNDVKEYTALGAHTYMYAHSLSTFTAFIETAYQEIRIFLIETYLKMCNLKRFKTFDYNVGTIQLHHFKVDNNISSKFQGVFE